MSDKIMDAIKYRLTESQKRQQAKILAGWVRGWMKARGCDMQEAVECVIGDHHVDPDFWRDYVEPLLPDAEDGLKEMMRKLKRRMELEKE